MNSPLTSTPSNFDSLAYFLENYRLFLRRFPVLAARIGLDTVEKAQDALYKLPGDYTLMPAKACTLDNMVFTLAIRGTFVHSKYNPEEEALRIFSSEFFSRKRIQDSCVFAGLGLGYVPLLYAEAHPHAQIRIIEPDVYTFLCFLAVQPLSNFLAHENLTLFIGDDSNDTAVFLASAGINEQMFFRHPVLTNIHKEWFDSFFGLFKRNISKHSINARTLKKFSTLWLKNTVKNIEPLYSYAKISILKGLFGNVPAVILAGGPSLSLHLSILKRYPQNYVLIAVDTALRACIAYGIIPDFILSFDPQYWNYLHTAGLDTSQTILISEAAAFPAVLRQNYKAVFLAHSSVPFAQYFEPNPDDDTKLAAGGSVATTAWDFARYLGSKPIVMTGLDLAFPNNQTHFRGSTFEESAHAESLRTDPAETANYTSLYSAFPSLHSDYRGGTVLTDRRMLMYAWWFESTLINNPDCTTYNLMPEGIHIPGMLACKEEEFAALLAHGPSRSAIYTALESALQCAYCETFIKNIPMRRKKIQEQLDFLLADIQNLKKNAEKAIRLCEALEHIVGPRRQHLLEQLSCCEYAIRTGFAKDIISILFFDEADVNTAVSAYAHARNVYLRIAEIANTAYTVIRR